MFTILSTINFLFFVHLCPFRHFLSLSRKSSTIINSRNRLWYFFKKTTTRHVFSVPNKLNPFPIKPWFLRGCSTCLLIILWEKEKLLVSSNFSFSQGVFYPFGNFSAIFIEFEIAVCKLFRFGRI